MVRPESIKLPTSSSSSKENRMLSNVAPTIDKIETLNYAEYSKHPTNGGNNLLAKDETTSNDSTTDEREGGAVEYMAADVEKSMKASAIKYHATAILKLLGEDPSRPGLEDTPLRYANALLDLTEGYSYNIRHLLNDAIYKAPNKEMVIVSGITFSSLCEHHILPFFGSCHIGYVPDESIMGLSKFARITEMFSKRLQVQEKLCDDIAQAIQEELCPQGVIVVMDATHMCMMMRGVRKEGSRTITKSTAGICRNPQYLSEFLSVINASERMR